MAARIEAGALSVRLQSLFHETVPARTMSRR